MIGTVTLNPCMDKTIVIRDFAYGGLNRVVSKREDASGKGINVSVALRQIGRDVKTIGIEYEEGSKDFNRGLKELGIEYKSIKVPGVLRENIKIRNESDSITTELNQKGFALCPDSVKAVDAFLKENINDLEILVVSGSVPEGIGEDYYSELIDFAREKNIKCILDAEGELLKKAVKSKPYLIKPNYYEFTNAFNIHSGSEREVIRVCREIISEGVKVVCLSMAEKGAMIADEKDIFICRPTNISVKSTQGAGDSLVAGICAAMEEGLGIADMLRYGVSVAQGSLIREGTQMCTLRDFEAFKKILKIEKLDGFI